MQRTLDFDAPKRRVKPNANSLGAYRSTVAPQLTELQQIVLDAARRLGEFTHDELHAAIGHYSGSTVRGRCAELVERGLIEKTEQNKRTESGNKTAVWRVVRTNNRADHAGADKPVERRTPNEND